MTYRFQKSNFEYTIHYTVYIIEGKIGVSIPGEPLCIIFIMYIGFAIRSIPVSIELLYFSMAECSKYWNHFKGDSRGSLDFAYFSII